MSIFNLPPPPATSDVTALSWRDWFYKLTVALKTFVANALPAGGTTGQYLVKNSNADQDAGWATLSVDLTNYAYKPGLSGGQTLHGGTGVTDTLKLVGTAGNGTATSLAMTLCTGNDGSVSAFNIYNNGAITVGSAPYRDPTYYAISMVKGIRIVDSSPVYGYPGLYIRSPGQGIIVSGYTDTSVSLHVDNSAGSPVYITHIDTYDSLAADMVNPSLQIYRHFTGAYAISGPWIDLQDSSSTADVTSADASILRYTVASALLDFRPRVVNGASALAYLLDTENTLSNAGAKLLSLRNNSVEKFVVYAAGTVKIAVPANYANDAAAATGGVPVGGVYRNGSVLQIRVT